MGSELGMALDVAVPEFCDMLGPEHLMERMLVVGPHLRCNLVREEDSPLPFGANERVRGGDHGVGEKRLA